jgi:drug/metabolite transporter (DMT)-like permease
MALMRWTPLFGRYTSVSRELSRRLWLRCGLALAVYIVAFNWAMRLTAASHVVLYLGASPVWALIWEERPRRSWGSLQRYGAALLALSGVVALLWPSLAASSTKAAGEALGLACSILWTHFGRECRAVGAKLSVAEITMHSFWRAGVLLAPVGLWEFCVKPVPWNATLAGVQAFCVLGGGIAAFGLWNHGLRHWNTSKVYLFNNLIPVSTMLWAHFCLGEQITRTFWLAMLLIAAGVLLGQTKWQTILGSRWVPED